MKYLYIIPMVVAFILAIYLFYSVIATNVTNNKPFKEDLYNNLYSMSYLPPFVWFVNPDEKDKKVKNIRKQIAEGNLGDKFEYRSFVTLQVSVLLISLVLFIISLGVIDNGEFLVKFLFNIQLQPIDNSDIGTIKICLGMFFLTLGILPKLILKFRADTQRFNFLKDIPVIQLFIILMLRSKRTIGDILFILSQTNTRYKTIFETAYRKYMRSKDDAFEYLQACFAETKFSETLTILEEFNDYSHSESITILENNMQEIIEYTNNLKRNKDLSRLIYSQGSLIFPFTACLLLGLVPVAYYGISLLGQASTF